MNFATTLEERVAPLQGDLLVVNRNSAEKMK